MEDLLKQMKQDFTDFCLEAEEFIKEQKQKEPVELNSKETRLEQLRRYLSTLEEMENDKALWIDDYREYGDIYERTKALIECEEEERTLFRQLPGFVVVKLKDIEAKYGEEDWFSDAWEEYRQHILNSNIDDRRMPSAIFDKYINGRKANEETK